MRSKRSTLERTRRFSAVLILPGAEANVVANWEKFFVANRACTVVGISISYTTASTTGGGTLTLERLQGAEAYGFGDDLLTAPIAIDGAINTAHAGTIVATGEEDLAVGDRLGILNAVGMAVLAGLCVTVELEEA